MFSGKILKAKVEGSGGGFLQDDLHVRSGSKKTIISIGDKLINPIL